MRVFVANFGQDNFAWPQCLSRSEVVTMQDRGVHSFWRDGDRKGYIDFSVANLKTMKGVSPTRSTAGRWFNLGTIITESAGDLWLHQDGRHLWWTTTLNEAPIIELGAETGVGGTAPSIYFYRKAAEPWSNKDRQGRPLEWRSLHPKCPDFLVTEATFQKLGERYADYAQALVDGRNLEPWHQLDTWRTSLKARSAGTVFNARQRTFAVLARRALETAAAANGQTVDRRMKLKNFEFHDAYELEAYIAELFDRQEGICALSEVPLQDDEGGDRQLCCSLDRIDSDGHYARGNLQLVCRFINAWKSNREDEEFKRLIDIVRSYGAAE